ncbi:hypothetical protein [Puniceibacterium sediminis]|nr:hypothetical protein [Puniceibacterium sediminis]
MSFSSGETVTVTAPMRVGQVQNPNLFVSVQAGDVKGRRQDRAV